VGTGGVSAPDVPDGTKAADWATEPPPPPGQRDGTPPPDFPGEPPEDWEPEYAFTASPLDVEPWYYGFLERWANVWKAWAIFWTVAMCVLITLACVLLPILAGKPEYLWLILALPFFWVYCLLQLLTVLFVVAWMLLAVDAGRRLRSIDRKTSEPQ
jgi:hypothetical protein